MGVRTGYRLHLFFALPNRISVELSSGLSTVTTAHSRHPKTTFDAAARPVFANLRCDRKIWGKQIYKVR